MKKETLLEVNHLNFSINGKQILKNINLQIYKNEIHSLLGVNGTGKSTFGYLIIGLTQYLSYQGEILYKKQDIKKMSVTERARLGLALAFQAPISFEGISVREYLKIGRKNNELAIEEALKIIGLNPDQYLHRTVDDSLSGGERKRIELASMLMLKPDFVILDEPDSGIDFISIQDIINYIHFLNKSGSTILLITHREEISHIADRSSLICNGTVWKTDKPIEISTYFKKRCDNCEHANQPDIKEFQNA